MIAVATGEGWILIGFVGLILWTVWAMLRRTFDLIDRAHDRQRAAQLSHQRQEAQVRGDGSNF